MTIRWHILRGGPLVRLVPFLGQRRAGPVLLATSMICALALLPRRAEVHTSW